MFCPECGTMSFPSPCGIIDCTNYKCGYNGPAGKMNVQGAEVDLATMSTTTKATDRVAMNHCGSTCCSNAVHSGSHYCANCLGSRGGCYPGTSYRQYPW